MERKSPFDYPGVRIDKGAVEPDGKHAFVWLDLDPTTKPGTLHFA